MKMLAILVALCGCDGPDLTIPPPAECVRNEVMCVENVLWVCEPAEPGAVVEWTRHLDCAESGLECNDAENPGCHRP